MLATLVIGLREGLEAALIVGIIAAFLKKNGKSLAPMWLGVGLAVVLSVIVGVVLGVVEQALPQAAQEGLESIIGAVAVFFVTGMIAWMHTHSRGLKRELEHEAADALGKGGHVALAVMAFLAVLKEGFETSVFLLATFSASQSALLAGLGATIGILIAIGIGWGIYAGGVRINLGRFFKATGAFLILVAAGLVMTTFRTAHEAGWLNAGQQQVVDLRWLVAPNSVQSALLTGVLGIQADPRLIEVVGWFAYLIPVVLYVYWPAAHRPKGRALLATQSGIAGGLAVVAIALAIAIPGPSKATPYPVPLVAQSAAGPVAAGTATLQLDPTGRPSGVLVVSADGTRSLVPLAAADAQPQGSGTVWQSDADADTADEPTTMTLTQLVTLAGGRAPIGLNVQQHPGPFDAAWSGRTRTTVNVAADGTLLDFTQDVNEVVAISGSGLSSPRTVTATDTTIAPTSDYTAAAQAAVAAARNAADERLLWAVEVPIALAIAALLLAAAALRNRRRLRMTVTAAATDAERRIVSPVLSDPALPKR